ncbi:GntR family transcriptional regulator [Gordonia sp. ABSL1-1]|uniref:GntR family transcriptional regulator n=1 Tax=Gordonia sp. ABSL1-1 TaxID=3053923 RepID=UPI002573D6A4|nr:GntR family transcriptional regulator [Gordonia sp. ABSL1-1]MDL9937906.1 GntR family transcriptional regulator [Gordonia sp. ABSL1-1]
MSDRLRAQLGLSESHLSRAHATGTDVLGELRRLILSGAARPGTPIPAGEVADAFAVSPIPVREALKTLVGEGLVVHRPNSGYRVGQMSADELREIYFIRGVLEQAALTGAVAHITDDEIDVARGHHEQLLTAARFHDGKSFHDVSREFHRRLCLPCGMPRLLTMFDATWNLTEPFQVMRAVDTYTQRLLNDDHAALLIAFADRDAQSVLQIAGIHHTRLESAIMATATRLDVLPDTPS